jgi:protoporphyrinogen oxidase
MKVGILGGGIAGLSFAYFLDNKSFILEKEEEIGGLCRSFEFKDIKYDIGPHIIFSKNKEILDLHTSFIETNVIKRNNSIFYKNRFIKYPFENDLGSLPEEDKEYCLKEFLNNPYKNYESNNMLQFFLKTFGEGITRSYLQPYNEKIWKFDSCCLDTQMVGRIPKPPDEDVIKSAQGIPTEGYTHQLYFHYPKEGGFQTLVNAYSDRIKEKSSIFRDVNIESIEKIKGKWVVKSNKGEFKSDLLVNCMPVHELFKYLEAPKSIEDALNNMLYNSIHIVLIRSEKDNLGDQFAVNVPDKDIIFHRISKLDMLGKNYESKDGGSTILAEITYRPNSYLSTLSKEQIKTSVIKGLNDCGFVEPSDITDIKVESHKYAYVIYDLMHRENTDKVLKYLRSIGIQSNGRFAEFEYMNSDKVAENSMKLAGDLNK